MRTKPLEAHLLQAYRDFQEEYDQSKGQLAGAGQAREGRASSHVAKVIFFQVHRRIKELLLRAHIEAVEKVWHFTSDVLGCNCWKLEQRGDDGSFPPEPAEHGSTLMPKMRHISRGSRKVQNLLVSCLDEVGKT